MSQPEFQYALGQRVLIISIDQQAYLTGLVAYPECVKYQVAYYYNGERREEWVYAFEITAYKG